VNDGYVGAGPDLGAIERRPLPALSLSDVSVVEGGTASSLVPTATPAAPPTKPAAGSSR
jgi:hypothetical protein